MDSVVHEPLVLSDEEIQLLAELLEVAHARLLVEIRHTDHRVFREELRARLERVEALQGRCRRN